MTQASIEKAERILKMLQECLDELDLLNDPVAAAHLAQVIDLVRERPNVEDFSTDSV